MESFLLKRNNSSNDLIGKPRFKIKIKIEKWQKHKSDEKGLKSPSPIRLN